jgi:hypothetical protein
MIRARRKSPKQRVVTIRNQNGRFARRVSLGKWRKALPSILRTVERQGVCVIVTRRQPATVMVSMSYYATLLLRWLSSPDRARAVDGESEGNTMTLDEAIARYIPEDYDLGEPQLPGDFLPEE